MDEQQHSLDEIFRQSLGDYREAPPAAAWEKVVTKLDEDDRNRRPGFSWRWPWIVLLLLLTIGGGLFLAARFQDGRPKEEQTEEFAAAGSTGEQDGSMAAPMTHVSADESKQTPETDHRPSSNNSLRTDSATKGITATSADVTSGTKPSNSTPLTASNYSEKKSKGNPTKKNEDELSVSANDEIVSPSESSVNKTGSATSDVNPENNAQPAENTVTPNSSTQKKAGNSKAGKTKKISVAAEQGTVAEDPVSAPAATKTTKTKSSGSNPGETSAAKTNSGNSAATPVTKSSAANNPSKGKTASTNQTAKSSSTSLNEPATKSASGKTGSKSTQKATPSQTTASPDAATTAAPKPSADATSATSSSAGAGRETASASGKAETGKVPAPRKAGKQMVATSPGFEESKAKDDLAQPAPEAAPKVESASAKDTSTSPESKAVTEPGNDPKGGEGSGSGDKGPRQKPSFSLALHGGYAFAMQKPAPNQFSAGFRLLWHFDPGVSVGIQPSIRYGNLSTSSSQSKTYQQASAVTVDSTVIADSTGKVFYRSYVPEQTFDSIVVAGLSAGGPIWQFEIPIILNYKFGRGWFAYGGPSVTFGGKIDHSNGDTKTYTIHRIDTVLSQPGTVQPPQSPASFENYFGTSSLPQYSTYQPAADEWKDPVNVRFGYLIGLGYEHKRLSFDVSLRQQISGFSDVLEPYRKVYSSPYVQIGVGWKIIPEKKK